MESLVYTKKPKISRPLPTELLCEQIMFIPLLRLFHSNGASKSTISAINWKFEVLRNERKNAHTKAEKAINEIVKKFNTASRARKMQFEGDNLDFSSLREENGLTKDDFRKGVLLYLCYGGNETAMLVNNVAITLPILNYIFIRPLLEQLFEFILESPNPFTMQKRICVGGHHPIHLPKSLDLPARVMASKGIQPQQLQQMVVQLESEKLMLERMMQMKVEPMDDSTAELPGIEGGCQQWPVDFEVAFAFEKMCLGN